MYAERVHEHCDIFLCVLAGIVAVESVGVFAKLVMNLSYGLTDDVGNLDTGGDGNFYSVSTCIVYECQNIPVSSG